MTEPRRIVLPPPTPDQLAYLEQIHRACTEYDGSQVVGGPRDALAGCSAEEVAAKLFRDPCSCQHPGTSFHERGSMVCLHEPREAEALSEKLMDEPALTLISPESPDDKGGLWRPGTAEIGATAAPCSKCFALDPAGVFLCEEHSRPVYVADHVEVTVGPLRASTSPLYEPDLDAPAPRPTDDVPVVLPVRTTPAEKAAYDAGTKTAKRHAESGRFSVEYTAMAVVQDALRAYREVTAKPGDDICMNGRLFLRELATVMGVIEPTADPNEVLPISEVMPKMLARAREDREKWHAPPRGLLIGPELFAAIWNAIDGSPEENITISEDNKYKLEALRTLAKIMPRPDQFPASGVVWQQPDAIEWLEANALKCKVRVAVNMPNVAAVELEVSKTYSQNGDLYIIAEPSAFVEVVPTHVFDAMTTAAAKAKGVLGAIADQRLLKNRGFSDDQLNIVDETLAELRTAFALGNPPETKAEPPIDAAAESFAASEGLAPPRPVQPVTHAPDCATKCRNQDLHKHECDCGAVS